MKRHNEWLVVSVVLAVLAISAISKAGDDLPPGIDGYTSIDELFDRGYGLEFKVLTDPGILVAKDRSFSERISGCPWVFEMREYGAKDRILKKGRKISALRVSPRSESKHFFEAKDEDHSVGRMYNPAVYDAATQRFAQYREIQCPGVLEIRVVKRKDLEEASPDEAALQRSTLSGDAGLSSNDAR